VCASIHLLTPISTHICNMCVHPFTYSPQYPPISVTCVCIHSPTHPNIHPTVFQPSPRPIYSSGLKYANFIRRQGNVLGGSAEKAKYMFIPRRQNARQNYNLLLFCYFLITRLVYYKIFFMFIYCFYFCFPFCVFCVFVFFVYCFFLCI
jgi:hypothetical protein